MFYILVMLRSYIIIIVQCQFKTSNQVVNLYLQFIMQFFINFIHSIIILKGLRVPNIHMLNLSDLYELHWKFCQSSNQITLEGNKIY